ncbi:MAG: ATP synthase subunit I [Actinobacteria bacterium]|nr:ATP synthase subunit I [Actinomycetota bacterium]
MSGGAFDRVDLQGLRSVLRRTILTAMILGGLAVVAALSFGQLLTGLGIVLGLGLAVLNLRAMDSAVAKVETKGEENPKVVRRLLSSRTAARLGIITLVAVVMVILLAPLGIGLVVGLVIFQLAFVANVARVVNLGRGGS